MTNWAIAWRVFVLVVLVGLAWNVPTFLGTDAWVGLALGAVVGIGAFFALGLADAARSQSD